MKIHFCKEQGSVLATVLVVGAVVGVALGGYLVWASQHNVQMKRSQAWNSAIPVLEAGIEEALSHLFYFPEPSTRGTNGWLLSTDGKNHFKARDLSDDSRFYVAISNVSPPVIYSSGFVKAPIRSGEWLPARTVRVETTPRPLFSVAMGFQQSIDINGNSVGIDSFDSRDPNHSTGGHYDVSKRKAGGNVSSNTGIFDVGNADIWGKVSYGETGSLDPGPNAVIGDVDWHKDSHLPNQGIQPGWISQDANVSFPPVPEAPPVGSGMSPPGGKVGSVTYQYILEDETYEVSDLTSGVYVKGDAKLIVAPGSKFSVDSSSQIVLAPGATLRIYNYAASATVHGDGIQNPGIAQDFIYWGMPSNKTIDLKGGAQIRGVIYAPDADVTLSGGGSTDSNIEGAVMARTFTINGGLSLHYDEALESIQEAGYIVVRWDEI